MKTIPAATTKAKTGRTAASGIPAVAALKARKDAMERGERPPLPRVPSGTATRWQHRPQRGQP